MPSRRISRRPARRRGAAALLAIAMLTVAACSSDGPVPARSSAVPSPSPSAPGSAGTSSAPAATSTVPGTSSTTAAIPVPDSAAGRAFAAMSERERIGQLLMVDCSTGAAITGGVPAATAAAITTNHVGSVILDGTSDAAAAAIGSLTSRLQALAPSAAKLFVATDQEGGEVQRLQGPGFTSIPSAVSQGQQSASSLRSDAATWGRELRAAGVQVDLAPVLDTVPSGGGSNPPIGDLDREYGHTPAAVSSHGVAVARGLADAGVVATAKHFPGLGRVTGNTDTTSGVRDDTTTRDDAYLAPFRAAVASGVPFVMVSTAIYTRIDPDHPAAFSRTVVTGMLRGDLGFRGVIISDDVGVAQQVAGYSIGERAVAFVRAGGDLVLTVDASQAAAMTSALRAESRRDPAFRRQVDAAALLVLQAKQAAGLL